MNIIIHKVAKVASGYEYFYSIFDANNQVVLGNQFQFIGKIQPKADELETWKTIRLARFEVEQQEQDASSTIENIEVSTVDIELIRLKAKIKVVALDMIKADSKVTVEQISFAVEAQLGEMAASMTEGFVLMYIDEAFTRGLVKEKSFLALKSFVDSTLRTQIQEIR